MTMRAAQELRASAAECDALARVTKSAFEREQWRDLERKWLALAEDEEKKG
jgi:hypothetical protein